MIRRPNRPMTRFSRLLLAAAILPIAAACVSTKDIDSIRRDINDVKRTVYAGGQKSLEETGQIAEKIDQQSKQLLKSNADVGVKIDDLTGQLQSLKGQLEDTNHRLTQLSQQIAVTQKELAALRAAGGALPAPSTPGLPETTVTGPPSTTSPAPGASTAPPAKGGTANPPPISRPPIAPTAADPTELFQGAYSDYLKGNYDLAIAGFREYVETWPKTENAPVAYYWIGECFFSQKKHRDAIAEFDAVVTRYPKSTKAPSALLKKGLAYLELGEKGRGASQLQFVAREYAGSEEATIARSKLKSLGVEPR